MTATSPSPSTLPASIMTSRSLFVILIFVASCNSRLDEKKRNPGFEEQTSFISPELEAACSRVIKSLNKEIHGVAFISKTGPVDKDLIVSLLNNISKYNISKNSTYKTFVRTCDNSHFFTWRSNNDKNIVTRIEKVVYKTDVDINGGRKNTIKLTDFDIYSIDKPNHLSLRIIDKDDFEYLVVDDEKYTQVSESILVGVDKAMARLDSLRNACR